VSGFGEDGQPLRFVAPRGLYIHVPLCVSKCAYCDFYSLPVSAIAASALEALVRNTIDRAERLADRFEAGAFGTVFIGGGTPTVLPRPLLERLLGGVGRLAGEPREWTVEANPESLSQTTIDILRAFGVNRLSIGVQSLDDATLHLLGRPHDSQGALSAVEAALAAGFEVSVDLLAGLPRPSDALPAPSVLGDALRPLLGTGLRHLSVYDLVLEEGSSLRSSVEKGHLLAQDEDEAWNERAAAGSLLAEAGLDRYEISNYAVPGHECLHNLGYWRLDSYIGAGPGAVSTLVSIPRGAAARKGIDGGFLRIEEAKVLAAGPGGGGVFAEEAVIGPRDAAFETVMMGFRTAFGVQGRRFRERFGFELEELIGETLGRWKDRLVEGRPLPDWMAVPQDREWGIALDDAGLDLESAFLRECLDEFERSFPRMPEDEAQTKKS
jgi:oxygen-independent coproporphyrinogen-3 oxidase